MTMLEAKLDDQVEKGKTQSARNLELEAQVQDLKEQLAQKLAQDLKVHSVSHTPQNRRENYPDQSNSKVKYDTELSADANFDDIDEEKGFDELNGRSVSTFAITSS